MQAQTDFKAKEKRLNLKKWDQYFTSYRPIQNDGLRLSLLSKVEKPQQANKNTFYMLKFKNMEGLKLEAPKEFDSSQTNQSNADPLYYAQIHVTLFSQQFGFFGRTYTGKQISLQLNKQDSYFTHNTPEWVVFQTQNESVDIRALVDIVLIEVGNEDRKRYQSVGFAIIPLFIPDQMNQIQVLRGNPRDAMASLDPSYVPQKSGVVINYEFKPERQKFNKLEEIIPVDCLCGEADSVPGVSGYKIPANIFEPSVQMKMSTMKTIYAHNIRVTSMNEVEKSFGQYLSSLYRAQGGKEQTFIIQERKLTVVPHNAWRCIGTSSFISLNKQVDGAIQSSGTLKILNFPMHPLIALIFRLYYRVQFTNQEGKNEFKDFVIGWNMHIPTLGEVSESIQDEELILDVCFGPGRTVLGDILWDQTIVRDQRKLIAKMGMTLSNSEDMVSELEKKRQEEILMKQAQEKVKKQVQDKDLEKEKELERLKQIQEENERLKREKEELEKQSKKPAEQLLQEATVKEEIVQAKEYYVNKNDEVETLIQQVLKQQREGQDNIIPKQLAEEGEQSIASLLKFLIQIVMQNYGPEAQKMESEARKEMTKKNLLEILQGDSNYNMNIFGSQGGMSMLQSKELSRQDKVNLLRLGIGKHLLDPETESKLLASEPRMDFEVNDPYKASTFTFKFVAFKTPILQNSVAAMPQKLYFTFKFFTFKEVKSESCLMTLPPDVEKQIKPQNASELNAQKQIKLGMQYYLVKIGQQNAQLQAKGPQDESVSVLFDVDPSISKVPDEHLHLARYLKERILTIDIWNGDSLMHYGTCKVPLHKVMRQGEPSKVIAQEFDICETEYGNNVGGLQLLISNEGRKVPDENINTANNFFSPVKDNKHLSTTSKHKKKVLSKPIENLKTTYDGQLASLAQTYQFQKETIDLTQQSEEARKRLRVERLKKQTLAQEIGLNDSLKDPQANDWQKLQALKQIEILRDTKKTQLLSSILKESMQHKQTIDGIPGSAQLVHFLVQNPFPNDEMFRIEIHDPDEAVVPQQELQVVHNEKQEWQYWFNEGKCARPSAWDIVSSKNDIILGPGQQCPVLLKFLSYREPVCEAALMERHVKGNQYELRPRIIKVTVMKEQYTVSSIEIKVVPREQYCDQTFRFYEPSNIKAYIKVPRFVPFSILGMNVKSSNKEINSDINQEGDIFVLVNTNRAPNTIQGFLFLYQDQFQSQLLACCKIEVHSMTFVRQKLNIGPEVAYSLQVRTNVKRTIEFYSSNPRLIFPPGRKERNIHIIMPNELMQIAVGMRAYAGGIHRATIHCVDINTKELIQSWLVEIEADKPLLQKAYQIELQANRHYPYKFPYANPLAQFATLEIVSSKPSIMQVRREKVAFEAQERKEIELYFPPQARAQTNEVILYINDDSGKVSESLLFRILVKE